MWAALLCILLGAAPAAAADAVRTEAAGLRFAVPADWTRVPATADVRAAQFNLPLAPGDTKPSELVLFFFGPGKGGGVQDNLDRWYRQFTQPDGKPSSEAAVLTIRTVHGLKVTQVALGGAYTAMNATAAEPDHRLLAAIIEGPEGPWFFKAVGPAASIERAKAGFDAMLASLEPHR